MTKTEIRISKITVLVLVVGAMLLAGVVSATEFGPWSIQAVDSGGKVGEYTSLALDVADNPCISYFDITNKDLKFAAWDGTAWQVQTVDNSKNAGEYSSLALDPGGIPGISYYDRKNGDLKFAAWDGSSWQIQTVDSSKNAGQYSSLAIDPEGRPRISYYDRKEGDLKFAAWDGAAWQIQTVDSSKNAGLYSSLALGADGSPRISYYDKKKGDLKFAALAGSSWRIETVDSSKNVGQFSSLALGADGSPQISYYDRKNGDLKFAAWDGSSWQIETVDSSGKVGEFTSLKLDINNDPRISYYDVKNGDLKFAAWNGAAWQIETVDSSGKVGAYSSLALDSAGDARISYYDRTNKDLKYAAGSGHKQTNEIAAQLFGQDISQGEYIEKVWPELLEGISPEARERLYTTKMNWLNTFDHLPDQQSANTFTGAKGLSRSSSISPISAADSGFPIPFSNSEMTIDYVVKKVYSTSWTEAMKVDFTPYNAPAITATTGLQKADGPPGLFTTWGYLPLNPYSQVKIGASYVVAKKVNYVLEPGYYRTYGNHAIKWDNPNAQLPWCKSLECDVMDWETKSQEVWINAEATQYTITTIPRTGGSISPSGAIKVNRGDSPEFTITPNNGYVINKILVDNSPVTQNPYKFPPVTADHTISATFTPIQTSVIPLVPAGVPFDSSKYDQNILRSNPMNFQCTWDGTGRVYISGDPYSLTGIYADDGYTITIQPSGASFDAPEHWAHQHPVVELTSGMTQGVNSFTLYVENWKKLSMSYGWSGGTTYQTPYIVQVNSP